MNKSVAFETIAITTGRIIRGSHHIVGLRGIIVGLRGIIVGLRGIIVGEGYDTRSEGIRSVRGVYYWSVRWVCARDITLQVHVYDVCVYVAGPV